MIAMMLMMMLLSMSRFVLWKQRCGFLSAPIHRVVLLLLLFVVLVSRDHHVSAAARNYGLRGGEKETGKKGSNDEGDLIATATALAKPKMVSSSSYEIPLSDRNFTAFIQSQSHVDVFVDFAASWSVWDQRLAPIWTKLAGTVHHQDHLKVAIAVVDCVDIAAKTCKEQKIMAYPTLRWYHKGLSVPPDYTGDRTVVAFMRHIKDRLASLYNDVDGKAAMATTTSSSPSKEGWASYDEEEDEAAPFVHHDNEPERLHALPSELTNMRDMCDKEGLSFGNPVADQKLVSSRGGDEFHIFAGQQVRVAPACNTPSANARGKYNSFFAPCQFMFHVIPQAKTQAQHSHQLSTECSDTNIYKHDPGMTITEATVVDYIRSWPDECVGDYRRCYSVSRPADYRIFLPHFCQSSWKIPSAVTHISVNCQDDKAMALVQQAKAEEMMKSRSAHPNSKNHMEQEEQHHREKIAVLLFVILLSCCSCWACLCLGYRFVVYPYLKSLKKSKSDPDLKSLVENTE